MFDTPWVSPGLPVHISRAPHNVKLVSWGRAADGWWGLINWEARIVRGIEPTTAPHHKRTALI